jgi:hypothetical protein
MIWEISVDFEEIWVGTIIKGIQNTPFATIKYLINNNVINIRAKLNVFSHRIE